MAIAFEPVSIEEATRNLGRALRQSKHRDLLKEFHDSDQPAVRLALTADDNKNSIASGISTALSKARGAHEAGDTSVEWALDVKVRNRKDGVFLVRPSMLPADSTENGDGSEDDDEDE